MFLRAITIAAKECPRLLILPDPFGLEDLDISLEAVEKEIGD